MVFTDKTCKYLTRFAHFFVELAKKATKLVKWNKIL